MSNLTGQAIQDTYKGLLNLENSTSGITSTLQPIQDGLGNNTGARIATNLFTMPNVRVSGNLNLKPDFMGIGFSATGQAPVANTQNRTLYLPFYDSGIHSYSAISYNLNTLSSTSDVVTCAFYDIQYVPGYGVAPRNLIMSGMTLESRAPSLTGIKTTTLPSTLSFSGTGGGFYIFAMIISNSGVTPTVRYTTPLLVNNNQMDNTFGFYQNNTGTQLFIGSRMVNLTSGQYQTLNNLTSFQSSYSESDITTNLSSTVFINTGYGFGLKTI